MLEIVVCNASLEIIIQSPFVLFFAFYIKRKCL